MRVPGHVGVSCATVGSRTVEGTPLASAAMTTNASGRSFVGTIRSAPGLAGRVEELEAEVARLRERVQVLESTLTALDAVRDEVAALSIAFTEELNRVAGTSTK